jgi:hypothetical protein
LYSSMSLQYLRKSLFNAMEHFQLSCQVKPVQSV